jgi:hypothetical protein
MLANEHCLNIMLHILRIVSNWINVLGNLNDVILTKILVVHRKGVAHGSFSERFLGNLDVGSNLTLLQQGLLPVDFYTLIFSNEPSVTNGIVYFRVFHFQIKRLNFESNKLLLILRSWLMPFDFLFFLFLYFCNNLFDVLFINYFFFILFFNDLKLLRSATFFVSR